MHQRLTADQIAALDATAPTATAMTRTEKLERWATLLAKYNYDIVLGDRLERRHPDDLKASAWPGSPMAIAFGDKTLKAAGLAGDTVGDAMNFFELTAEDIHALSCNCGGVATGENMAARVRGFIQQTAVGRADSAVATFAFMLAATCTLGMMVGYLIG